MKINRDDKITVRQVEDIRRSVGWDPNLGKYKAALKNNYATFSIRDKNRLIAFARVVSDGSIYALIVDLNVRPEFQNKGIGKKLMRYIVKSMKEDGIKWVNLIFDPEDKKLNHFYRALGFRITNAGYIRLY